MQPLDLLNHQFGYLIVVAQAPPVYKEKRRAWKCKCVCGNIVAVSTKNLRKGATRSCGCLQKEIATEVNTRHGEAKRGRVSREHIIWQHLQSRCYNPADPAYKNYGGRGITMAGEWLGEGGFEAFLAHVGRRPGPEYSLDRFPDNNGNYEPGNVRWATLRQQANNKRTTVVLEMGGESQPLSYWAEQVGIPSATIYARIHKYNWSVEDALTIPVKQKG